MDSLLIVTNMKQIIKILIVLIQMNLSMPIYKVVQILFNCIEVEMILNNSNTLYQKITNLTIQLLNNMLQSHSQNLKILIRAINLFIVLFINNKLSYHLVKSKIYPLLYQFVRQIQERS